MRLLRNREVLFTLGAMALVTVTGVIFASFISAVAAGIVSAVSLVLIGLFVAFTNWRYREVDKLADYLVQVTQGDYSLNLRDNVEGELSILKSEIYKVTVMLNEQAATLRQEKVSLADALSDISHQLKTPLTSMFVMTDLLCGDLPEAKRAEFTGKLRSQLERIQWLVTSLLKLSKLDAGTVVFRKDLTSANRVVQSASEPLQILMELKSQSLVVNCPEFEFYCDLNWTVEALVNILKNCVEHTPKGGEIRINCINNPLYTEITVEDSGAGIDKSDLPYIFNRFYKGKNAGDDSVGIGLAMAKSIVVSQGGSIDVRSSSVGTKFMLRLYT